MARGFTTFDPISSFLKNYLAGQQIMEKRESLEIEKKLLNARTKLIDLQTEKATKEAEARLQGGPDIEAMIAQAVGGRVAGEPGEEDEPEGPPTAIQVPRISGVPAQFQGLPQAGRAAYEAKGSAGLKDVLSARKTLIELIKPKAPAGAATNKRKVLNDITGVGGPLADDALALVDAAGGVDEVDERSLYGIRAQAMRVKTLEKDRKALDKEALKLGIETEGLTDDEVKSAILREGTLKTENYRAGIITRAVRSVSQKFGIGAKGVDYNEETAKELELLNFPDIAREFRARMPKRTEAPKTEEQTTSYVNQAVEVLGKVKSFFTPTEKPKAEGSSPAPAAAPAFNVRGAQAKIASMDAAQLRQTIEEIKGGKGKMGLLDERTRSGLMKFAEQRLRVISGE